MLERIITVLYVSLCMVETTGATVTWTQHSMRNGNPQYEGTAIRPNISCDGSAILFVHRCRTNNCSSEQQDGGSVYKINLSTNTTTRIISGIIGDDTRITYADPNEDTSVIAFTSTFDYIGDLDPNIYRGVPQVYIYLPASNTYERLTTYQNRETLYPNMSCDGNIVCWASFTDPSHPELWWASQGQAYCYNRATDIISMITTDINKPTYWISPNNDGTKYVVSSREPLAGALPPNYELDPQIYYFNGNEWSRLGLFDAGESRIPEPNFANNEEKIVFAVRSWSVEGGEEHTENDKRIAFQYEFISGLITRLFVHDPTDPWVVADYVSANNNGNIVAVLSDANLNEGAATSGQDVYSGIYTPSSQTIQSGSPVDLAITDMQGNICAKDLCNLPGCIYFEHDFNGDGEPNDRIWCDPRPQGVTELAIIPDATAQPADTYSLISATTGEPPLVLASNETIENIPPIPYEIMVPPYYPLDLLSARIQPRNSTFRIKGSFQMPEPAGELTLIITDDIATLPFNLGNISSYTASPTGNSLKSTILVNSSAIKITLRKHFLKSTFQHWSVSITGSNIDLNTFAGGDNKKISYDLANNGNILHKSAMMIRRSNSDLSFKK